MSAANPTKQEIEAMLDGLIYRDGAGERRRLVVSDERDYESVRVAYNGTVADTDPRATWVIECSAPYPTDLMPLCGAILRALAGRLVTPFAWQSDPSIPDSEGYVTATLQAQALGLITA